MESQQPQKIGRYKIKAELGRGGMATVYHAVDPRFKRDVALKVLPPQFLHDPTFRARFEREAQTIATLEHSAIVPVYDFGEDNGQLYLVMRYLPGGRLTDLLRKGPLPIERVTYITERLAAALDEAHRRGVIHRDLKADNILFDQHQDPFVTDFGIAKLSQEGGNLTVDNAVIGTPAYMSPEQVNGEKIDKRSDIYSFGIIIFQMLTGKLPYEAPTPVSLLMKHITEPVPDILDVKPDLPPGYTAIIAKAMAKDKEDRYETAASLATALAFASSMVESTDTVHVVNCPNCQTPNQVEAIRCIKCGTFLGDQNPEQIQAGLVNIEVETDNLQVLMDELAVPDQQDKAIDGLVRIGNRAIRPMVETLLHSDKLQARIGAVQVLDRLCQGSKVQASIKARIVQVLTRVLIDPNPEIRYWAAEAIGKFSHQLSEPAVEPLTMLLHDSDENVRRQARASLKKISGESAAIDQTPSATVLRLRIGEEGRQMELALDKGDIYLGRSDPSSSFHPQIDLTNFQGIDRGVSRKHARIYYYEDTLAIEDMGSSNGTFLNGRRLPPNVPHALYDADRVYLGALRIEVELD